MHPTKPYHSLITFTILLQHYSHGAWIKFVLLLS